MLYSLLGKEDGGRVGWVTIASTPCAEGERALDFQFGRGKRFDCSEDLEQRRPGALDPARSQQCPTVAGS